MYEIRTRIGASQTNIDGYFRDSAIVDLMQDCSGFQLEADTGVMPYFMEHNIAMFLVFRQIDILRRPAYGEEVTAQTSIYDLRQLYGFRNSNIFGADGKPCILSYAMGAFVNRETGRPLRMPQEVLDTVRLEPATEMEYLPHKLKFPKEGWEELAAYTVTRFQIDVNRHVNNARYLDIGAEYLPEGFDAKRICIAYKSPAKLGDILVPERMFVPEGCLIRLRRADGSVVCEIAFTA
ncbi:MAG: acyl-ACP thioesterase [Ruminococcus sp.]|nr:acyl-ACP thioesterase [Ruminococcus sp.]